MAARTELEQAQPCTRFRTEFSTLFQRVRRGETLSCSNFEVSTRLALEQAGETGPWTLNACNSYNSEPIVVKFLHNTLLGIGFMLNTLWYEIIMVITIVKIIVIKKNNNRYLKN